MMYRIMSALLMVSLVAGFGCAKGKYSAPRQTFETAWEAAKAGDRAALTACFDQPSQTALQAIEQTRAGLGDAPNIPKSMLDAIISEAQRGTHQINNETVDGDRATLRVAVNEKEQVYRLVRENGQWKFDSSADLAKVQQGLELIKKFKDAAANFQQKQQQRRQR